MRTKSLKVAQGVIEKSIAETGIKLSLVVVGDFYYVVSSLEAARLQRDGYEPYQEETTSGFRGTAFDRKGIARRVFIPTK